MIRTKRRGLKVAVACAVMLMLLLSMLPGSPVVMSPKVEAYGENEDGTLFYAEATLYDYKYDREVGSYEYDHDNQIAYKLQGGDQHEMTQEQCHDLINGDRWMTGLQVPYERLNRKLSSYYSGTGVPALYLGNFYGTATNLSEVRGNGINQTPWQYTYIPGQSGDKSYADAYSNFWESANAAPLNNNGNVAIQGLVDRKLTNGNLTQGNGAVAMPLFSDSFINANSDLMKKYPTSNGFPFNIIQNADGTRTYKFDSAYDAPRYYSNGAFVIGTQAQNGVANWRSDGNSVTAGGYGFFPFNSSSITDTEVGRQQVNYGFGMKVNIPFNLSENGTILDKDNNEVDVIFEFSGDDDVWVFVDGVLMLDLGGDHAKVQGSINFNRNKQGVWIDHASTFNSGRSKYEKATSAEGGGAMNSTITAMYQAAGETFNADNFYNPTTQHTLTVFYMERGMFESNLSISFNFAPVNQHLLTVKEETKFNNVNPALLKQTVEVADQDIFNYSIENKGTSAAAVKDSGFMTPTYEYINRNNTDEGNNDLINRLSGQTPTYVNQKSFTEMTGFDDEFLYLDLSQVNWADADACIMAWIWGGSYGSGRYARVAYDSNSGRYRVERKNATGMQLYRFKGGSYPNYGSSNFNDQNDKELWDYYNNNITIPSDKNVFKLTGWDNSGYWSSSTVQKTVTVSNTQTVLSQTTHNFEPSGADFNDVANVTYQLTDPFGDVQQTLNRDTTANGTFDLMYNEEAFFQFQFQKGSTMRVKQDTTLRKPMNNRAVTMGSQNGTRQVSDYYYSTVDVKDIDNVELLSYDVNAFGRYNEGDGTYTFANAPTSTSKIVHLTETYINTVKVGDLVISKDVDGETGSTRAFTFDVVLSNLFGDTTGMNVDTKDLLYYVYPAGTTDFYGTPPDHSGLVGDGITITEDQIAVILGIPVNTTYMVTERNDPYYVQDSLSNASGVITVGSYTFDPAGDVTGTIVGNDGASAVSVAAVNSRKVGKLVVTKQVTGSGADSNDSFPVTVTLTAPQDDNVDLADYITEDVIVLSGSVSDLSINLPQISFKVKDGSSVTIQNIPYGVTYTVSEEAGDYTKTITYSDENKVIDDIAAAGTTAEGQPDTVSIVNNKAAAQIVLTKKNNLGTKIAGAEFEIVCEIANDGSQKDIDYTVSYTKSDGGKVFTFGKLKPKTTYLIRETKVPEGHQGVEPFTVTTTEADSTVYKDVFNPVIEIVMPETGVLPAPLNMTIIGLSVIGLAVLALIFYRKKLLAAIYTEDKEV